MEFTAPSFLEGYDTEELLERMLERLPSDIDVSEGSHPYNLIAPTAYEISYLMEYVLPEAIKLIFPQFCEDYADIMEYHAANRGITRKEAQYATGTLEITGEPGTDITMGTVFSTVSVNDEASVEFETTEDAVIGNSGIVMVPIKAVLPGVAGNVSAGTILIMDESIDNVSSVTNPEATSGGVEEESIEDLQQRIMEHDALRDESYGGSTADYKRWALSVSGTGSAVVISPTDDTSPIQIIITDSAGNPATEELCTEVYNYIMRPDNEDERLAPVNHHIVVLAPSTLKMTISATVELSPGVTLDSVKASLLETIKAYIPEAAEVGEVRYSKVGSIISNTNGIEDYIDLRINGDTVNIPVSDSYIPSITSAGLILTEGTV